MHLTEMIRQMYLNNSMRQALSEDSSSKNQKSADNVSSSSALNQEGINISNLNLTQLEPTSNRASGEKEKKKKPGIVRRISRRLSKDSLQFVRRMSSVMPKRSISSATFNIEEPGLQYNALDINTASVEEFMTLPGITRQIAEAIVAHRKNIGTFRRPEDIALVSGVGAAMFHAFRSDICVKPGLRRNSTDRSSLRSSRSLNVNKASIFELMTVPGMTQEMAAAIVHRREEKGSFRSLQDLKRVRSINFRFMLAFMPYLTVEDGGSISEELTSNGLSKCASSTSSMQNSERFGSVEGGIQVITQKEQIQALVLALEQVEASTLLPAGEPIAESFFRLGSWNLDGFCCDKISNPGVIDVVCRTILRNSFSLMMLQGILEEDAVSKLCCELNKRRRSHNSAVWDYLYSSTSLAIIYLNGCAVLEDIIPSNGHPACLKVQLVKFKVLGESLVLINCHFESKEVLNLSSSDFVNQFEAFCESDKIVAAVSTTCRQSIGKLAEKFRPCFDAADTSWKRDDIKVTATAFDSIFLTNSTAQYFTGKCYARCIFKSCFL
ncbi:hypothetical protein QYM36_000483 [Artemia franciscana]|uniref:Endonuclease/exonuclease/phosphatase family domain-containing protein 1 n=1 Tax=Artemia franciscana TaxID=6661 RepID=A0AA88IF07_ARTSF|nr:hypothetical protein QYM36_000483 [Artemia franciscana]